MCTIHKIEIITRPEKLEDLKEALNKIAVTGMTVSNVYGCGLSKGHKEDIVELLSKLHCIRK